MSLLYTYTPDVPQGSQQINNTQQPINQNFQDIYDLLAINHIPFNTADTFGRHTIVNYVNQNEDPETGSSEMALYSKQIEGDPNISQLFYRYPNNGNVVRLGENIGGISGGFFSYSGTTADFGQAVAGWWQYLSNGILMTTFILSNGVPVGAPTPTSPYTFTFPTGTYTGGVTVPTYTQTPYCVILAGQFSSGGGQNINYAASAVDNTSGLMYYNGSFTSGVINPIQVTLIGI